MADTPACSICGAEEDTWRHSLLSCRMARCVWALGDDELLEHVISNQNPDARLWLFWLFETTSQQDLTCVLVTMWAIWWARRKAIHEEEFQSPLLTMSFIRRFLEELNIVEAQQPCSSLMHAAPKACAWLPPDGEAVKINCDGAISTLGEKGAAAVVSEIKQGSSLEHQH